MKPSSKENGGQLLQELEALSQALYKAQIVHTANPPVTKREFDQMSHRRRASEAVGRPERQATNPNAPESRHSISDIGLRNKNATGSSELKEGDELGEIDAEKLAGGVNQKKGIWNWKPLRALSHIGQQRFPCEFSAHIHGIDKLPASMNGLRLQIQLRHRDTGVQTRPSRVSHGCAEFEEILQFRCTVYGSKSKSSGTTKYIAKSFTLSVVAMDIQELDLGKHQLDLSRILPSQDQTTATATTAWNTSFKLSGKAKGSSLAVTFGYEILEGSSSSKLLGTRLSPAIRSGAGVGASRSFNSLPNSPHTSKFHKKTSSSVADFSPSVSEPGNEYMEYAGMDHFKLDDPEELPPPPPPPQLTGPPGLPPPAPPPTSMSNKQQAGLGSDRRGRSLFPEIDAKIAPGTPGRSRELEEKVELVDVEQSELLDDADFGVVEKGVETSVLEDVYSSFAMDGQQEQPQQQQQQQKQEQNLDFKLEDEQDDADRQDQEQDHQEVIVEEHPEQERSSDAKLEEDQEDVDAVESYDPWKNNVTVGNQSGYDWKTELEQDDLLDSFKGSSWKAIEDAREEEKVADYDLQDEDGSSDHDIVADEFLDMLGGGGDDRHDNKEADEEADSPRALLLKQFEKESMLEGGAFDLDGEFDSLKEDPPKLQEPEEREWNDEKVGGAAPPPRTEKIVPEDWSYSDDDDKELASIMDAAESELQKATQALRSKARAKMLEDAEAEALLQEWGLDENIFHDDEPSPPLPQEQEPMTSSLVVRSKLADEELPPLAPGVGSSVPTADGGTLRSMDPVLFESSTGKKSDGKLVMHVSKPVVVPAEVGASAIDVLRNFAAAGSESMAAQAMEAMPLEDITGKSVAQIAMEGQVRFEENNRRYDTALLEANRYALDDGSNGSSRALTIPASSSALYQPGTRKKQELGAPSSKGHEFVSLDELAPVAMEKIEQLAMQGLKIQCDMADEEAPYAIEASSVPLIKGSSSSSPLLLEAPSSDGMISMSLSLDEWMRLDAGLDDDDEATERTKSVMAAHRAAHATTTDLVLNVGGDNPNLDGKGGDGGGKMGKTLTLAMLVQLRDPLRNFEPVGAPMMALVEAERVFVPPKPKLWKRVAIKGNSEQPDEDDEEVAAEARDEEEEEREIGVEPQFKVTGVHIAGMSAAADDAASVLAAKAAGKKPEWGNQRQQQSGSRWLVANGMGKNSSAKHPLLRSKAAAGAAKGRNDPSSSLWSISSSSSSPSVARNPDVKFAKAGAGKKRF